jgi:hypothetical protein
MKANKKKYRNPAEKSRMLADGYAALRLPQGEFYEQAAEALEEMEDTGSAVEQEQKPERD